MDFYFYGLAGVPARLVQPAVSALRVRGYGAHIVAPGRDMDLDLPGGWAIFGDVIVAECFEKRDDNRLWYFPGSTAMLSRLGRLLDRGLPDVIAVPDIPTAERVTKLDGRARGNVWIAPDRPERMADCMEMWAFGWPPTTVCQYAFQRRHSAVPVLNIGCDVDTPDFGEELLATNVDILAYSHILDRPNKAHFICDARDLPGDWTGQFATTILGDILEHMTDSDQVRSLREARRCAERVVVTIPHDGRTVREQQPAMQGGEEYAPGVAAGHERLVTQEMMRARIAEAGLTVLRCEPIDYEFAPGSGFVLT